MLILLRHAKANPAGPGDTDHERTLSDSGFRDARQVSEILRQQELIPELIISSSAVRAMTTAYQFAATFEKPETEIKLMTSLYDCFVKDYLAVISSLSEKYSTCLITGHNETITEVAQYLLGKNVEPLNTCGVVVISSQAATWLEFDSSECTLHFATRPMQVI